MTEIQIRLMVETDLPSVLLIEEASFVLPWSLESFKAELRYNPAARYFVAFEKDDLVAFGGMHLIFEEGHLIHLAVREDRRGQGVGRKLAQAMLRYASNLGAAWMTLEVRKSNVPAISLYRSLGFFQVSVRKEYYEDNREDALLMVCDRLPPADPDFEEAEAPVETEGNTRTSHSRRPL